MNYFVLINLVY